MKKMITTTTIAAGLIAGMASAEVAVTLDFASAYVFRGVTLNDGAVLQPGIEVSGFEIPEAYGALALGAWGNYDLDDYGPAGATSSSFQETDWYGSYSLPALVEGLDLFVGYCEYSYGAGASDKEANVGAGYSIGDLAVGLTWYQGVGGLIGSQSYIEAVIGYALEISEDLSASVDATAGFLDPSADGADSGFNDYSIGVSVGYAITDAWSAGASLAYIGQGDDKVLGDSSAAAAGYDVSAVGVLSIACEM